MLFFQGPVANLDRWQISARKKIKWKDMKAQKLKMKRNEATKG